MEKKLNQLGFHYIRYSISANQKYLKFFLDKYDNLIINGKTVASNGNALSLFLPGITKKVKFIIDPETHAFQHNPSHIESNTKKNRGKRIIKRSIKMLIKAYGEPIESITNSGRSLDPSDFTVKNLKPFCKRVLDFQLKTIKKEESKPEVSEYYDFLKGKNKIKDDTVRPSFLIAPYFYLCETSFDEWMDLNIKCIETSLILNKDCEVPLAAQLVISKDILTNHEKFEKIIEKYNSIKLQKIFLWIDSFSEQEVSEFCLVKYIELLDRLNSKTIVNLFGGYFSIVLKKLKICENLVGVSHGIGFGEERSVVPVGGGLPAAKFYLPRLHKRLIFRESTQTIVPFGGHKDKKSFFKEICDCETCQLIIKNDPINDFENYGITSTSPKDSKEYPTSETRDNCTTHYMYCKIKEYSSSINQQDFEEELKYVYSKLKNILPDQISHCLKWINAIK